MEEDKRYKAAKKRVADIRDFYTHLVVYFTVITFLVLLNIFITGSFPWVVFVIGGWGIGIVMHAWDVFGEKRLFGPDWEERKIAEILGEKPKRSKRDDLFEEKSTE